MIVTQIRPRRRSCCSNLVLRRAPRPHDMKLRQHGRRSWPCWLPNAGNHPPVKTARKGTPHEKSSSPRESCFFRGLDWRGVSMLHRAAIPLVTHSAASCLVPGDLLVLHLKIDIFCHLSIFFLTSAHKRPFLREKQGKSRQFIFRIGVDFRRVFCYNVVGYFAAVHPPPFYCGGKQTASAERGAFA